MVNIRLLTNRRDLEQRALKISEETGTNIRVHTANGSLNIEVADEELQNKKVFTGDIEECSLFIEGIRSFIDVNRRIKN